ncbi:unnamed protein product [Cuscuta campestris]|uniref:Uncharacterized protein n=1 Tax=Cuscuta campestris TaxID=132261 RepID=A0A484KKP7_9ASTE|nr:unnamed protein product [Cuscuta campestris]
MILWCLMTKAECWLINEDCHVPKELPSNATSAHTSGRVKHEAKANMIQDVESWSSYQIVAGLWKLCGRGVVSSFFLIARL